VDVPSEIAANLNDTRERYSLDPLAERELKRGRRDAAVAFPIRTKDLAKLRSRINRNLAVAANGYM